MFDVLSGETHFLGELPTLLLEQISEQPVTFEEISRCIDAPADLPSDASDQIRKAIVVLEQNELIDSEFQSVSDS